jgi:hypothetical protein
MYGCSVDESWFIYGTMAQPQGCYTWRLTATGCIGYVPLGSRRRLSSITVFPNPGTD